ncbi:ribosome silencing factor [Legionella sp. W05-934-2]|uniref:ribosome silencing factor n=1 Tax=Legionella sp. W05-934-2 TaxID=1198649 RepID=UPI0034635D53
MTQKTLLERIIHELEEAKANQIDVIDVSDKTSVTNCMVICSGRSTRHVKSTAEILVEKLKHAGFQPISKEGIDRGEWALIDYNDIIVHIMHPDHRAYYNLEELWQKARPQEDHG